MDPRALFRPEALAAREQADALGLVGRTHWRLSGAVLGTGLLLLTAGGAFAIGVPLAVSETVPGHLVPVDGVTRLAAPREGLVLALHAREGAAVEAGAPLVTLAGARHRTGDTGSDVDTALAASATTELARLERQRAAERQAAARRREALADRLATLGWQVTAIEERRRAADELLELQEQRRPRVDRLASGGFLSRASAEEFAEKLLRARQEAAAVRELLARTETELAQAAGELAQLDVQLEGSLARLDREAEGIVQRRLELDTRRESLLRAPTAGRVTGLAVHAGLRVEAGRPLLTLVPLDALFEAELFVPARAVGLLREGQTVRLRFDAYPYQRHGVHRGTVRSVASALSVPQELTSPAAVQGAFYRVRVHLADQSVVAYGREHALRAGLSLQADVIRDRRSVLQWLLDPLHAARRLA